jgi:uncharacterized membrane protein
MTDQDAAAPARTARWLRWLLVASLALNLLVLGAMAGRMLRGDIGAPQAIVLRDLSFGPYTEAMGPADRAALRRAFAERAPPLREIWRTRRAEQEALVAAIRAEPFDAARVAELLAAQAERTTERLRTGQTVLVERIAAMSAAERAAFAQRLEAAFRRAHLGRRGDEGDGREGRGGEGRGGEGRGGEGRGGEGRGGEGRGGEGRGG